MTKLLSPGAACVIPEILGGLPVTELADRLFAGSPVEEVYLPRTLVKIGRYGFYSCEKLHSLHFYSGTTEIGGGIFNGCRNVRELFLHMENDGRSALRDFVTEINERLVVHMFFPDGDGSEQEKVRLVFPEYFDEAVENTPARITVSNIHGSGQRYRYCFSDRKVRFEQYDQVFVYEKAEEPLLLAAELAQLRLQYPVELSDGARREYESFLRESLPEILFGSMKDTGRFKWLFKYFADPETAKEPAALSKETLDALTAGAADLKLSEISGILMDYRLRTEGAQKKRPRFEL